MMANSLGRGLLLTALVLGAAGAGAAERPARTPTAGCRAESGDHGPTTAAAGTLDPAGFIRIIEDTRSGERRYPYDPCSWPSPDTRAGTQFAVDLESTVLIEPAAALIDDDSALNGLLVTARLTSGDSSREVQVLGYSEIGRDKAEMAAQRAAAFRSAAGVEAMFLDMSWIAADILRKVYGRNPPDDRSALDFRSWSEAALDVPLEGTEAKGLERDLQEGGPPRQALRDALRLYRPEIEAIAAFFQRKENLSIVESVGSAIFWMDRNSLEAVARQYQADLATAFDDNAKPDAQAAALARLLERTKGVYRDFRDERQKIVELMGDAASGVRSPREWQPRYQRAVDEYSKRLRHDMFAKLKEQLVTGSISLPGCQAKDGDRLTITVESMVSAGASGGMPVIFNVAVRKFGAKLQWSPSLLFVRRLGVTDSEASPADGSTAVNRVNFAASPGVTFGVAWFQRGSRRRDKFLRALAPGVGMNVTFLNFSDPRFDTTTGKFAATTGTSVEFGAGVIASFFDNKLQLGYGWNLNVERRRSYFAVGFGFLEVGKEIAKYVGK